MVSMAFVIGSCWTSNAVPKEMLGSFQGISFTVVCCVRTIAPALLGGAFSWSISHPHPAPFDFHFAFAIMSAVWFFTSWAAGRLGRSISQPYEAQNSGKARLNT